MEALISPKFPFRFSLIIAGIDQSRFDSTIWRSVDLFFIVFWYPFSPPWIRVVIFALAHQTIMTASWMDQIHGINLLSPYLLFSYITDPTNSLCSRSHSSFFRIFCRGDLANALRASLSQKHSLPCRFALHRSICNGSMSSSCISFDSGVNGPGSGRVAFRRGGRSNRA